jgi:hypothetical protein
MGTKCTRRLHRDLGTLLWVEQAEVDLTGPC